MADGTIGSVKVRVRPDTSHFREDAKEDLERIEKKLLISVPAELDYRSLKKSAVEAVRKLNEELKNGPKAQFKAEISESGMKKEVKNAARKLNALAKGESIEFRTDLNTSSVEQVRKAVQSLGDDLADELDKTMTLHYDPNSFSDVRSALDKVMSELDDKSRIDVEVDLDEDSLVSMRAKLEAELASARINEGLKLHIDKSSLASVTAAIAAIDAEVSRNREVEIDFDIDEASLLKAKAELELLSRTLDTTRVNGITAGSALKGLASGIGRLSGLRFGAGFGREFRDFFMNIDKNVPLIGGLAAAAEGLGGALLTAGANTFSLSRALAQIGPGALALPGIFGGIAIGLGSTVAVFKDFNKEIPGVGKALGKIQDQMSEKFWDRARAPIQNLVDTLLPQLGSGLTKTGKALGVFWGNLATSLNGELDGALAGMFKDLNASIREMATHTDSIATIIRVLGEAGAGRLPELAEWVGTLTDKLAKFLDTSQKTGKLDGWIDTSVARIKQLGNVLLNTGKFFGGLAIAADNATPGDALTSLADAMDRAQKVVNGSGFQTKLTNLLKAAHDEMNAISTQAGPAFTNFFSQMATTLTTTLPKTGDALGKLFESIFSMLSSPAVQQGYVSLMTGIANGISAFAPAIASLGPKMGAFMALIGQMAETFGSVLGAMVESFAPVATAMAEAITPIVAALGPVVTKVIQDLGPIFAQVAENVGKVGAALLPLVGQFQALWALLGPILVPVLKLVVEFLGSAMVNTINGVVLAFKGIVQIIDGVIQVFTGLWDVIAGLFTGDFSRIGDGFGKIWSGLKDIAVGALKAVAGAVWAWLNGSIFGIFRTGGVKLATHFKGIWEKFGPIVKAVFDTIKTILGTAWTVIKVIFEAGAKVVTTAFKLAWTVMSTIIKTYFTVWKTIITTAWTVIKTIFSTAWTVISTVVKGAWTAIVEWFSTTLNALYFVFSGPWNAISGFLLGLMNTMRAGITLAWDAIKLGIETVMVYVRTLIEIGWAAIKTATTATWNAIKAVISAVWTAIRTAVTTYVNAVKTVVTTVWNAIKSVTNTVWNGIKSVITKVWNTIRSAVQSAVSKVKSLVTTAWNNLKGNTTSVWNTIKSAISKAWETIKSLVSGAVNAVKGHVSDAWNTIKGSTSEAWANIKEAVSKAWDKIKTSVEEGVKKVIEKAKALPGDVKTALGDLSRTLYDSGKALLGGFAQGITDKIADVYNAAKAGLNKVKKLFPHSPAKEGPFSGRGYTTYSGRALMEGFAEGIRAGSVKTFAAAHEAQKKTQAQIQQWDLLGLKASAEQIVRVLVDGIAGATEMDFFKNGLSTLDNKISAAIDKMGKKAKKKAKTKLHSLIGAKQDQFAPLMDRWNEIQDQIDGKVEEIRNAGQALKEQVAGVLVELGNPLNIALDEGEELTFDKILQNMKDAVGKAREFKDVMDGLRGLGLNNETMQQLYAGGPDAIDAAKAIKDAGKAGVDALNEQQTALTALADAAGETAKTQYVEAGMNAAQGFLDGLRSKQVELEDQMRLLADALVKQVKKALKIKSPSRVFRQLGGYTGEGFALGVKDKQADAEKAILGLTSARPSGIDVNNRALAMSGSGSNVSKTINYYAPAGSGSLSGEEALFQGLNRARSNGF